MQEEILKFWQSSKNDIVWSSIELEGNPFRGNLVNWRGKIMYLKNVDSNCCQKMIELIQFIVILIFYSGIILFLNLPNPKLEIGYYRVRRENDYN